jgi:hypothetical protein
VQESQSLRNITADLNDDLTTSVHGLVPKEIVPLQTKRQQLLALCSTLVTKIKKQKASKWLLSDGLKHLQRSVFLLNRTGSISACIWRQRVRILAEPALLDLKLSFDRQHDLPYIPSPLPTRVVLNFGQKKMVSRCFLSG